MGRASTYHKIRDRESYAFALASAAVALDMDGDTVRDGAHRHRRPRHAALARPRGGAGAGRQAADAGRPPARPATPRLQGAKPGHDNGFRIELGARTVADALMIAKQRA